MAGRGADDGRIDALGAHVPPVLLRWLADAPERAEHEVTGTLVFADVSGFTRLSERLARAGREGAETLVDLIDTTFSTLLEIAHRHGGEMLKFGGDALLLLFTGEGHELRAVAGADAMRSALRAAKNGSAPRLRMSIGVQTGAITFVLAGTTQRELIVCGPVAGGVVGLEAAAGAGQIVMSAETAAALPPACRGAPCGEGLLLRRVPAGVTKRHGAASASATAESVRACLPAHVSAYVASGPHMPEHRSAAVAFVRFRGVGRLLEAGGGRASQALGALVEQVASAAADHGVCLLDSDVDGDGGKLRLTAGAPLAAGDDEERLLLALRRVADIDCGLELAAGAHRGPVFTGEIGPAFRHTYAVMGDTVNLAARLMGKAAPGRICVSDEMMKRVPGRFDATAQGPFTLKGKARPVAAWDLGAPRRLRPPARQANTPPIVGRDHELALLAGAVADVRAGAGRLVDIVGEAGIGKTRLVEEACRLADGFAVTAAACESAAAAVPYALWRELLRELLGVSWDEPDAGVLERLTAAVADAGLSDELALIAVPFGLDVEPDAQIAALAAPFRAARTHAAVVSLLRARARTPRVVAIEHAHAIDAASAALLAALADGLAGVPWLVVVTRRPGGAFAASDGAHVRRLEPGPLSPEAALTLARQATADRPLPPHLLELAVQRSDGSPQLLFDLLDAAARGGGEGLPDSVEAALSAQIDALDPRDRGLVRRAAVLGATFRAQDVPIVLEAGAPQPDEAAWERVAAVVERGADGSIRFRRTALREAAYEGLPFRIRRELHAAVADDLEARLRAGGRAEPAVLSWHLVLAGEPGRGRDFALMAAQRASERFAHADAARLLRRAIEAGRAAGLAPERLVDDWEALGAALLHIGELDDASDAFAAARRLTADPVRTAALMLGHAQVTERAGRVTATARWIGRATKELDGIASPEADALRARLTSMLAGLRQRQGRAREAQRLCREAIVQAEAAGEERALAHACYVLDWALTALGRSGEAVHSTRALEIYERLGDVEHEAKVLNNLGMFAFYAGHWDDAVDLYQRAAEQSRRAGDHANAAYGDCNVGEVLSDQGKQAEARPYLERALQVWRGTGDDHGVAFATMLLGRLSVREGRVADGEALLLDARERLRGLRLDADAQLADALLGEAAVFRNDPIRALAIAGRLIAAGSPTPLVMRVRGLALAQVGDFEAARDAIGSSLTAAREEGSDYDTAAALDALELLDGIETGRGTGTRTEERDTLLDRLRIARLPAPPLGHAAPMARDATIFV